MRSSSQSQVSSSQKKINFSDLDFSLDEKKLWRECKKTLEKDHYFPLVLSFLSDFETPLSLCHKLKADFLLESVEMMESIGRYSIIASGKREQISFRGNNIDYRCIARGQKPTSKNCKLSKKVNFTSAEPLVEIQNHYLRRRVAEVSFDVPPFCGGLIGYMGFEVAGYFEKIPTSKDVLNVPDVILVFPQLVAVYDNAKRIVSLIYLLASPFFADELNFSLSQEGIDHRQDARKTSNKRIKIEESENLFYEGLTFLRNTQKQLLKEKVKLPVASPTQIEEAKNSWRNRKSNFTKKRYMAMVDKAKKYILQGEIFQVVLSQRFSFPCSLSPFEIYRNLRRLNPSPYLYYLNFGELALVGSSPETMASLSGKELGVVPIAGTCARGKNAEEDEQLGQALLADEKECAEHLMLVDLGRNDLGRVASAGSVKLKRYMQLEKYSHVQHIVSEVMAEKKAGVDAIDLIKATFPAGTLSGAPKVRAMQIISELEKEKRGPYGGIVFYLSLSGNFDSCITIRTLLLKDGVGYVQAGAGIVHDSKPDSEYQECLNKSRVIFRAVEQAGARVKEFNN